MSCPRRGYDPRSKGADRTRPRPRLVALELFAAGRCCCCCWLAAAGLGWEAGGGACLETSTVHGGGWDASQRHQTALLGSPERRESTVGCGPHKNRTIQGTGRCNLEKTMSCPRRGYDPRSKGADRTRPRTRLVALELFAAGRCGAGRAGPGQSGALDLDLDDAAASLAQTTSCVADGGGGEQGGPRPPGAPSGAWSLLAVRRPTGKRNALNPPGGKPGAWQHVAEVPVSLSFSTGRADVLRMGWGGGGVRGLTSARVCTGRNVRRRGDSSVAAKVSPLAIALEAERLHLCASQRTNPSPKATDCALTRQRKWKRILNGRASPESGHGPVFEALSVSPSRCTQSEKN